VRDRKLDLNLAEYLAGTKTVSTHRKLMPPHIISTDFGLNRDIRHGSYARDNSSMEVTPEPPNKRTKTKDHVRKSGLRICLERTTRINKISLAVDGVRLKSTQTLFPCYPQLSDKLEQRRDSLDILEPLKTLLVQHEASVNRNTTCPLLSPSWVPRPVASPSPACST
jgi:hypothetical protein